MTLDKEIPDLPQQNPQQQEPKSNLSLEKNKKKTNKKNMAIKKDKNLTIKYKISDEQCSKYIQSSKNINQVCESTFNNEKEFVPDRDFLEKNSKILHVQCRTVWKGNKTTNIKELNKNW